MTEYSRQDEYNNEIKQHVKEILLLCDKYQIPVFMTFAVGNNRSNTDYITETLSASAEDVVLAEDRISKYILIGCGFDIVPAKKELTYEELLETIE